MIRRADNFAISVQSLSKSYAIDSAQPKDSTLAETLLKRVRSPWKAFSRRQETFSALRDLNFNIAKGDVVGVIGRNGAGKSTLLKILSRITEPTSGRIDLFGRVGSLLEVGTGFHPELTGKENIYLNGAILGMRRHEITRQFDAIVDFAGVERFLETPVKRYSSGMYVRLAFAVAAHLQSDILIVDEVLAVGDAEFQAKCLGKMKDVASDGRTVLFVSHNMAAVKNLCSRALFLVGGGLCFDGSTASAVDLYLRTAAPNDFQPPRGPLKRVHIRQDNLAIHLEAEWEHAHPLSLPNLGFVLYDQMGTPIVGTNPRLAGTERLAKASSSGRVTARLLEPRLLDGQYYVSVWFGDGAQDFVEWPKCLSLEIKGMAGPRQLPASVVGPVSATCEFSFH